MTTVTPAATVRPLVLADLIPRSRLRDAALVVGCAVFMALAAQVSVPLWFTPVPLSLGTFAVLLSGAALGPLRAGLGLGLYLIVGLLGAPVFSDGGSGWSFPSFGYIIGFVVAGVVVGAFAARGADRSPWQTAAVAVLGSLLIYAAGVPWLMADLGVSFTKALDLGVYPFLAGDAIKAAAAAALLPVAWKLVGRNR